MKTLTYLPLFLCFFLTLKSTAQNTTSFPTLHLEPPFKDSIHLRPYISIFADKSRSMSFQEVQNQVFTPIESFQPDSKYQAGRYYYWYRFSVENTTSDTIKMSLSMPIYDSIVIYPVQNGQTFAPVTVGFLIRKHPQPEKAMFPSNRTALLDFPPHSTQQYYVRCHRQGYAHYFYPKLFNQKSEANYFLWDLIRYYAWNACFMGILIFVFAMSLLNYAQTRHQAFLYYMGYIMTQFFYYWFYLESDDLFINILPIWIFDYYYYIPLAWGWALFYLLFLMRFFETKQKLPQMHFFLKVSLVTYFFVLLIERILVSYDYWTAWEMSVYGKFLLNFICFPPLLYTMWQLRRNWLAIYILMGSLCYALGSLGTRFFNNTNYLWDDSLIYNQLGILFELLFFSMGLAYKFRLDAIDKERYFIENQRLELEKALTLANLRNQIAQDIHDEIGAGLTKIALSAQFTLRLPDLTIADVRDKVKRLESDTRYLAAKLREIVFAINPEYDDFDEMQAYFRDTAQHFWAESNMELIFDFPKSATQFTVPPDKKRHLLLIFTEIQNNIAKHAQATQVHLTFKMTTTHEFKLSIQDNGVGFAPLSKNGFSKGLSGMKNRAESIKATFLLESSEGEGTLISLNGTF